MRVVGVLVASLLLASHAVADCPPACMPGGGPAATDCFVAWGGIAAPAATCMDGAPCDVDGVADGTCTFAVQACVNVAGMAGCAAGALAAPPTVKGKDANAAVLRTALAALDPAAPGCMPATLSVPLKVSLAGLKPGKSKMTVTASSGGKRDRDRLRFVCQPDTTPRSLAADVQPIFGLRVDGVLQGRCAYSGCHASANEGGSLSLAPGDAYASTVNVRATTPGFTKVMRVTPGSIRKSFLARKILGVSIGPTSPMPQGCPTFRPAGDCLTPAEKLTILYWIANGAQP
jgi:hypothetical protein